MSTGLKLLGSSGRFGVRYGQSVKKRIIEIEEKQRKMQACPFCGGRAKRLSKGIWECKKCSKKFASHAYFLEQQINKAQQENAKLLNKEKAVILEDKEARLKKSKKSKKEKTE